MIDTTQTSYEPLDIKHISDSIQHEPNASRQQVEEKIEALEKIIQSLNALFGTHLIEDDKELVLLMKITGKLIRQKEALQWSLMTEKERQLRRQAAEHFGRKAQSSVGGTRILERE